MQTVLPVTGLVLNVFQGLFQQVDCVKYTQVVQERFHSGEFCAGLSCTLVLPALRSNKDPEASLRTALWTELPSLSKTQKVTTNWGRKYKHFKQAQVGDYWEAVKKKEKKSHLISSPASGSTWGQKVSSVRAIILLSVKAVRPAEVPSPASSVWFALYSCKSVSGGA